MTTVEERPFKITAWPIIYHEGTQQKSETTIMWPFFYRKREGERVKMKIRPLMMHYERDATSWTLALFFYSIYIHLSAIRKILFILPLLTYIDKKTQAVTTAVLGFGLIVIKIAKNQHYIHIIPLFFSYAKKERDKKKKLIQYIGLWYIRWKDYTKDIQMILPFFRIETKKFNIIHLFPLLGYQARKDEEPYKELSTLFPFFRIRINKTYPKFFTIHLLWPFFKFVIRKKLNKTTKEEELSWSIRLLPFFWIKHSPQKKRGFFFFLIFWNFTRQSSLVAILPFYFKYKGDDGRIVRGYGSKKEEFEYTYICGYYYSEIRTMEMDEIYERKWTRIILPCYYKHQDSSQHEKETKCYFPLFYEKKMGVNRSLFIFPLLLYLEWGARFTKVKGYLNKIISPIYMMHTKVESSKNVKQEPELRKTHRFFLIFTLLIRQKFMSNEFIGYTIAATPYYQFDYTKKRQKLKIFLCLYVLYDELETSWILPLLITYIKLKYFKNREGVREREDLVCILAGGSFVYMKDSSSIISWCIIAYFYKKNDSQTTLFLLPICSLHIIKKSTSTLHALFCGLIVYRRSAYYTDEITDYFMVLPFYFGKMEYKKKKKVLGVHIIFPLFFISKWEPNEWHVLSLLGFYSQDEYSKLLCVLWGMYTSKRYNRRVATEYTIIGWLLFIHVGQQSSRHTMPQSFIKKNIFKKSKSRNHYLFLGCCYYANDANRNRSFISPLLIYIKKELDFSLCSLIGIVEWKNQSRHWVYSMPFLVRFSNSTNEIHNFFLSKVVRYMPYIIQIIHTDYVSKMNVLLLFLYKKDTIDREASWQLLYIPMMEKALFMVKLEKTSQTTAQRQSHMNILHISSFPLFYYQARRIVCHIKRRDIRMKKLVTSSFSMFWWTPRIALVNAYVNMVNHVVYFWIFPVVMFRVVNGKRLYHASTFKDELMVSFFFLFSPKLSLAYLEKYYTYNTEDHEFKCYLLCLFFFFTNYCKNQYQLIQFNVLYALTPLLSLGTFYMNSSRPLAMNEYHVYLMPLFKYYRKREKVNNNETLKTYLSSLWLFHERFALIGYFYSFVNDQVNRWLFVYPFLYLSKNTHEVIIKSLYLPTFDSISLAIFSHKMCYLNGQPFKRITFFYPFIYRFSLVNDETFYYFLYLYPKIALGKLWNRRLTHHGTPGIRKGIYVFPLFCYTNFNSNLENRTLFVFCYFFWKHIASFYYSHYQHTNIPEQKLIYIPFVAFYRKRVNEVTQFAMGWLIWHWLAILRYSIRENPRHVKFGVFPIFRYDRSSGVFAKWCLIPFIPVKYSFQANMLVYTKEVFSSGGLNDDGTERKEEREQSITVRFLFRIIRYFHDTRHNNTTIEWNPFFMLERENDYRSWNAFGGIFGHKREGGRGKKRLCCVYF